MKEAHDMTLRSWFDSRPRLLRGSDTEVSNTKVNPQHPYSSLSVRVIVCGCGAYALS